MFDFGGHARFNNAKSSKNSKKAFNFDDGDYADYMGLGPSDGDEYYEPYVFPYWDKKNTKRMPSVPHEHDHLKEETKKIALSGNKPQLNFYVTSVSTIYAPSFFGYDTFYKNSASGIDPLAGNLLKSHSTILQDQHYRYKDLIVVKGSLVPSEGAKKSKKVFAIIDYDPDKYGPTFFLDSREGFDHATYEELPEVRKAVPQDALVSRMPPSADSVDKFVRYIQNYMYYLKNRESGSEHKVNPNAILSYIYRPNEKNYKSFYGYVPEPNEGGPNRYILEMRLLSNSFAKKFYKFFMSDEYLNLVAKQVVPTIRCFESGHEFDTKWRFEYEIQFGHCYSTRNYTHPTNAQISATFNHAFGKEDATYIILQQNSLTPLPEGSKFGDLSIPKTVLECIDPPFNSCNLTKLAFDIEANNTQDKLLNYIAFPVAKWTPKAFADRYKGLLIKSDYERISYCKTAEVARHELIELLAKTENYVNYCNKAFPSVFHKQMALPRRKEILSSTYIPKLTETDPVTVVAFVIRQNEDGTQIKSEKGSFIYTFRAPEKENASTHETVNAPRANIVAGSVLKPQVTLVAKPLPKLQLPILKPPPLVPNATPPRIPQLKPQLKVTPPVKLKEIPKLSIPNIPLPSNMQQTRKSHTPLSCENIKENPHFSNTQIREFDTEGEMLFKLFETWQQICPDFILGHNITTFDLPYLIDRVEELCSRDFTLAEKFRRTPFTFSFLKGAKAAYYNYSFDRNSAQKTTWTIKAPGMMFFDTWVGLKHTTFGQRLSSYKLGSLMTAFLTYPGSDIKMRKLEIDILTSSQLWKNRGDGLSYFLGYCKYDAVGSAMLAERLKLIQSAMSVSVTSGASPGSIFLKGVQNIIINMIYKTIWYNGKTYLFPDYDYRELHFMDLWYAHHDPKHNGKLVYEDVRYLYETVPTLKRKWKMGGLRSIPDLRNDPNQYTKNKYLPKVGTPEYDVACYSKKEIEEAMKSVSVKIAPGEINPVTKERNTTKVEQKVTVPAKLPKTKPYVGARVFQVMRGVHFKIFIPTWDKTSMYPTIAEANGLDFPNLVTEFIMRAFKIKRYTCQRIILGPESLIQVGDVIEDRYAARENGISDTDKVIYCYYYQNSVPRRSIFANMVRSLLAHRKMAKFLDEIWKRMVGRYKMCVIILDEFLKESEHIDKISKILDKLADICITPIGAEGKDSPDKFDGMDYLKKLITTISPYKGVTMTEELTYKLIDQIIYTDTAGPTALVFGKPPPVILTPVTQRPIDYLGFLKGNVIRPALKRAAIESGIADTDQLSDKLVMNSGYGGVSMSDGILPQIWLGSSITALGRKCISRAGNIIENTDLLCEFENMGPKAVAQVEKNAGKTFEQMRKEHAETRQKNYTEHRTNILNTFPKFAPIYPEKAPYRNITMALTNGDTDSTIAAIPPHVLKVNPENLSLIQTKGNASKGEGPGLGITIADKVNFFLPYKLCDYYKKDLIKEAMGKKTFNGSEFDPRVRSHIVRGLMSNECEKIATLCSLIQKCKMYIQYVIMPTGKPEKNYKGVSPKKTDTVPYASKLIKKLCEDFMFKSLADDETPRDRICKALTYTNQQLVELLKGNYNPEDFKMNTKLQRPISSYVNPQDHVRVALKKEVRGETVNVGDTISLVYVTNTGFQQDIPAVFDLDKLNATLQQFESASMYDRIEKEKAAEKIEHQTCLTNAKIKDSRTVEDSEYAFKNNIPLDILYYLEVKIIPKLALFFAPLLFCPGDYPEIPYGVANNAKKHIKKLQEKIEKYQNDIATQVIKKGIRDWINAITLHRLQRECISIKSEHEIRLISQTRIHRCVRCMEYFEINDNDPIPPNYAFGNYAKGVGKSIVIHHFIAETPDKAGFYAVCMACQNSTSQQSMLESMQAKKAELSEKYQKLENACWDCIEKTGVSMRASMVEKVKAATAKGTKHLLKKEELYFKNPSDCTQRECENYKEKRTIQYMDQKIQCSIGVIRDIPMW